MTPAPATPALDVLVIGGGQAGLAMGYHMAQRGLHFKIVDVGGKVGAAWRSRWDSLRAFTPAQYDNLPGLAFPAAADTYPGKMTSPTTYRPTRHTSSCRCCSTPW